MESNITFTIELQTTKYRVMIDNSIPNRKVYIKLSNINFLWNTERLFEQTANKLPIEDIYHIGKEHKEDTIDLLTRLNRI